MVFLRLTVQHFLLNPFCKLTELNKDSKIFTVMANNSSISSKTICLNVRRIVLILIKIKANEAINYP